MDFGTLALVVACGLAGPLLAGLPRLGVPLVVGELAAGVLVGPTGLDLIDPTEPTIDFLAQVGFALLMFVVGTHLPLRDVRLRPAAGRGLGLALATIAVAVPTGWVIAAATDLDEPLLIALLVATGSAAVAMPALAEGGHLGTSRGLVVAAWITVADIAGITALPLVTARGDVLQVAAGGLAVTGATVAVWVALRGLRRQGWFRRYRRLSKRRKWGLDLRISLLILFALAWLAGELGTGILVAGFSAGAVVAAFGPPRRLAWQVLGIAEGLFVPLFFVTLGARLDLRELAGSPSEVGFAAALAAAVVAVHLLVAGAARLPPAIGLVASAQLGVPAAAAAIGLQEGILTPAQGAAVMLAAIACIAAFTVGMRLLGAAVGDEATPAGPEPGPGTGRPPHRGG